MLWTSILMLFLVSTVKCHEDYKIKWQGFTDALSELWENFRGTCRNINDEMSALHKEFGEVAKEQMDVVGLRYTDFGEYCRNQLTDFGSQFQGTWAKFLEIIGIENMDLNKNLKV